MSARCVKKRLDLRLVEEGMADSLQAAGALIMAGEVLIDGQPASSAGQPVKDAAVVRLKSGSGGWVSRGAHKLLTAVERFQLKLENRVCLDVGASTGGFTQVMLKHGAAKVYAVDVGYGLLDWSLRTDPRVVVMERQNARFLTVEMFAPRPDFACSDASFISLRLLLNPLAAATAAEAEAVVLVKPQFEARREDLGEGGVVRSPEVHRAVLEDLADFVGRETPWGLEEATWSGIKGPKGNIEFLFRLRKNMTSASVDFYELVRVSHETLAR